jgi:hypothetical protein
VAKGIKCGTSRSKYPGVQGPAKFGRNPSVTEGNNEGHNALTDRFAVELLDHGWGSITDEDRECDEVIDRKVGLLNSAHLTSTSFQLLLFLTFVACEIKS